MEDSDVTSNATAAAVAAAEPTHVLMVNTNANKNQIIISKVVSSLSAMGSAYIFISMLLGAKGGSNRQKKLERTFNRLLLCLCVSDFVSSVSIFLGSW